MIGVYRGLKHVHGSLKDPSFDNRFVERIAELMISGGMFGISNGLLWLALVTYGEASEAYLLYAMSIGGILGSLLIGGFRMARGITRRFADKIAERLGYRFTIDETVRTLGGMSFGVLVGGSTMAIGLRAGGGGDLGLFGDILGGVIFAVFLLFWLYGMGIGLGVCLILLVVKRIGNMVYAGYIVLVSREKMIICGKCLRYTHPLHGRYEHGNRFCEHCQQEVERTKERGKVIVTFDYPLTANGREFILSTPEFEQQEHPIEVSIVYLNTNSCDYRLFERFITYILNYPPTNGAQSIQIRYTGMLDNLGENLKNVLQNTFYHVEQIS